MSFTDPNFVLLYVDRPADSAAFYRSVLGKDPVESSPTFAMFALNSGVRLGLWSRHTAEPAPAAWGGCGELAFAVESLGAVDDKYDEWRDRGLPMLQERTEMDFGYTFVALDPDGHRLRVFCPAPES